MQNFCAVFILYILTNVNVYSFTRNGSKMVKKLYTGRISRGWGHFQTMLYAREGTPTDMTQVSISEQAPMICQFIIPRPGVILDESILSRIYGDTSQENIKLQQNPVIYISSDHSQYGTLGYVLNRRADDAKVGSIYPELRHLRDRPVFEGGPPSSGSSLTMIHKLAELPDNRPFATRYDKPDFQLFFNPDLAMANELCSTNDAQPTDFRFFRWASVWPPGQLDREYQAGRWLTLDGPVEMVFDEQENLHDRIINYLQER